MPENFRQELVDFQHNYGHTTGDLMELVADMKEELGKGLVDENANLKMLPTYLHELPTGEEVGDCLAVDLGGSNFRVLKISFRGLGIPPLVDSQKYVIGTNLMTGTSEQLFDFIADCISKSITDASRVYALGFTFSFPMDVSSPCRATLVRWTKGFYIPDAINKDVGKLLMDACCRRGIKISIKAIINDTVGALYTRSLKDQQTKIGMIIGTGFNACYLEPDSIPKLEKPGRPNSFETPMVVNIEMGSFSAESLRRIPEDLELDRLSVNPGDGITEKMVSGMYMGELVRLQILRLHENNILFRDRRLSKHCPLRRPYSFDTSVMAQIEKDSDTELIETNKALLLTFEMPSNLEERILVKQLVSAISSRSARIAACAVIAICDQLKAVGGITVAVDGSIFKKYPYYRERMTDVTFRLSLGKPYEVTLKPALDGSGIGSAACSLVAANCTPAPSEKNHGSTGSTGSLASQASQK